MKNISISIILIVIIISATISCNKEDDKIIYETVKPLPYFPVYPGSWWRYEINDTTIKESKVSNDYMVHNYIYTPESYSEPQEYTDKVYVPFLDSMPIYGYDKIEWIRSPFGNYYTEWPILSETIGFEFQREWMDWRYGDFTEKVKVIEKIFNGSDTILILEGHWVYGPNVSKKSYQEYTRNIGLTKELIVDTLNMETVYKKVLIDYFINN